MTFGQRLLKMRESAGLTQAQLSEASGVPLQTLKQYELGYRTRVPFTGVVAIAKALGVSCEAFAGCEDIAAETAPPDDQAGQVEPPVAEVKAVEVKAAAKGKRKKS